MLPYRPPFVEEPRPAGSAPLKAGEEILPATHRLLPNGEEIEQECGSDTTEHLS
jgi:hypothetical protein